MTPLIIICIYLSLLLLLGIFASTMFKGSSKDYMLASHSIGPFLLLMSLFGTTMTAFALVGSTGEAYAEGVGVYGQLASSSGIIHSLCFFVLGIKLWSFGKKYGYTTQIQFFRDRLQSDKIGLLLFPILAGLVVPYLLIGVMASGMFINGVTEGAFSNNFAAYDYGVPPYLGSLAICVIVLIYVFFGGMRGTAWANAFQTMVFMVLGVVTFWVISSQLGGVQAASQAVAEKHPSKLMRVVAPEDKETYEQTLTRWKTLAEYNYAVRVKDSIELSNAQKDAAYGDYKGPKIGNWTSVAEAAFSKKNDLIQLTIAEKNDAFMKQDDRVMPAEKPSWWATEVMDGEKLNKYPREEAAQLKAYKIFADKIGHPDQFVDPDDESKGKHMSRKVARGIYRATNWSPEEPRSMSMIYFISYMFVPLSVGMFPHLFQHWLTAKSADSFKLPVVAHPIFIAIVWVPCILVGIWATSAIIGGRPLPPHFPPNAVLAKMVGDMSGPFLTGLLSAGVLAAIMSSLDSQFLCMGTMFTEDIVVHYGGKNRFSDRQIVIIARIFIILIVAVTYSLSLLEPRRVFTLGVWTFSGFSSLFPLVFAALYWKRLTKIGAYACVLAAISMWCYLFYDSDFALNPHYAFLGMVPAAGIVMFSTAVMILVSLVTTPPDEEHLERFFPTKKNEEPASSEA